MTDFYPPTIVPPAEPLGTMRSLLAAIRNPLEAWSDDFFERDVDAIEIPGSRFITVLSPELAQTVLLDDAKAYRKSDLVDRLLRPAMGDSLLTAEGETWRSQRRAVAPLFRPDQTDAFVAPMARIAEEAGIRLGNAPQGTPVDIMAEMAKTSLDIIVELLLGDPGDAYDRDEASRDISHYLETSGKLGLFDYLGLPEWMPRRRHRGMAAVERLRESARRVAADPTDSARGGLTKLLRDAVDPATHAPLTSEKIVDNIVTFVGAGHETTAMTLTWALSILAHCPDLQDALEDEARSICGDRPVEADDIGKLKLCDRVIKETMRVYPPAAAVGRTALIETRLGDMTVRPGDHVTVAIYVIHRHRRYWSDPGRFDPERFGETAGTERHRFAFMPFGGGARICVGMSLAQREAIVFLSTLMRRIRVLPDPSQRITPQFNVTLRPKGGLKLFVRPVRA